MQGNQNCSQRLHEDKPNEAAFTLKPDSCKAREGADKGANHRHTPQITYLAQSLQESRLRGGEEAKEDCNPDQSDLCRPQSVTKKPDRDALAQEPDGDHRQCPLYQMRSKENAAHAAERRLVTARDAISRTPLDPMPRPAVCWTMPSRLL